MPVDHSNQTFGVEIEFTRIQRHFAARVIADFFDTSPTPRIMWGYEVYDIQDRSGRTWKVLRDASIEPERLSGSDVVTGDDEYQCELVTPVLNYADLPMLQDLIRELRTAGASPNKSCGLHVHVGADGFTPNQLRILCNIVFAKQDLLFKAVRVKSDRQRYCQSLSADFIQRLNKKKPKTMTALSDIWYFGVRGARNDRYNESRYRVLNLHQLLSNRLKTIEFRIFNSTMHAGKVKTYVQLSLLIVTQALNQRKATSRVTVPSNFNDKYSLRVWILRMQGSGSEFKTMRYHLLKPLSGDSAFRDPSRREEQEPALAEVT
ncbi:amidoligase family protein [Paenibacillus sp. EPM92]|uniref:amidoligase family protein n=1 Tax=Paenibacillus sp. EPM92 TaxID=1561195 RepID=UPI001916AF14|nr:amidoligase family protein [Paenibacillus sp. EPM92]